MKTESYKWWEDVQSKLHQNFDNVRLSATHILWLSENFPPTKCEQADVIKSVCDQCRFENECRFKAENVEQNCKFFIDKQTVL